MWKYKVTFMVSCDLSYPELRACLWDDELAAAFVSVPETPVHEDAGPVLGQDYVRRARQGAHTFTETVSATPQLTPCRLFRTGVFRMYACHTLVALLGCQMLGYIETIRALPKS